MTQNIHQFLTCSEKVLFTGTYNINDLVQPSPSIVSLNLLVEANPDGYNILIDNFYNTQDKLLPPNNFLLETITISSYKNNINEKVGQIQFTGFYKNVTIPSESSAETDKDFVLYEVISASGIYEKVSKVLLDAKSDQRILFFIGK